MTTATADGALGERGPFPIGQVLIASFCNLLTAASSALHVAVLVFLLRDPDGFLGDVPDGVTTILPTDAEVVLAFTHWGGMLLLALLLWALALTFGSRRRARACWTVAGVSAAVLVLNVLISYAP